MASLLVLGYEDLIRSKFGVDEYDLPDEDINQPTIINLAKSIVAKRVPDYELVDDLTDTLLLQGAVAAYTCYLITPSMPRRLNIEVATLDTKWKKDRVNWDEMAVKFISEFENLLASITTVDVVGGGSDYPISGLIRRDRDPI